MLTRRLVCALTGAVLIAPRHGFAAPREDGWLRCLPDLRAAVRMGRHLQTEYGDRLDDLCAPASDRLVTLAHSADAETLDRLIAVDFRRGRTVTLRGIVLSQTEVALYRQAYRAAAGL